ncbi:hypothetical protein FWH09_01255 [Candidatus Saccharibacteria bacterium]|nr:hypothetical protein [Candidatus Saccharibacteria bacterium]
MIQFVRRIIWVVVVLALLAVFFFVPFPTGELTADASKFADGECLPPPADVCFGELCPAVCYGQERKTLFQMIFGGGD